MKNPGLAVSAAKYLASKKINLIGIDSPSIDLGKDGKFSVHHILAKNGILIVENLTNLGKINSGKISSNCSTVKTQKCYRLTC